jgi:hypothetical protein
MQTFLELRIGLHNSYRLVLPVANSLLCRINVIFAAFLFPRLSARILNWKIFFNNAKIDEKIAGSLSPVDTQSYA